MTSPNIVPYIGSKICLISDANIRYEGTLCNIDTANSTMGLVNVRTFGTEGRKMGRDEVPPSDDVYDYIVFQGKEIKDLIVSEPAPPDDPAIVAVNQIPSPQQPVTAGVPQVGSGNRQYVHHMGGGNQPNRMSNNQFMSSYMMCQGGVQPSHQRMMGMDGQQSSFDPNARKMNVYVGMNNYRNMDYNRMGQGTHRRGASQYGMSHNSGHQLSGNPLLHRRGAGYANHRGRGSNYFGNYNNYSYNNFGGGNNQRRIIGELKPQPNQTLRSACESAFNFEESNMKFDKATLTVTQQEKSTDEKSNQNVDTSQNGTAAAVPVVKSVYDKNSSFFDNISCEVLDHQEGQDNRSDRNKQRQLDVETFGQEANQTRLGLRNNNRMQRRPGSGYNRRPMTGHMSTIGGGSHMGIGGYGGVEGFQYVPAVRY